MGNLIGNAVRFDVAHDVMAAGEGIETMLSLRCVLPTMPMVAALASLRLWRRKRTRSAPAPWIKCSGIMPHRRAPVRRACFR
jgi:hypothetical protein